MVNETANNEKMMIIDGSNLVFGRFATTVAKQLLLGKEVHVFNAEKIIIRGNPSQISGRYLLKRSIKHKGTPERSPVWSRVPHMLVKRMVRGMLPRKSSRGVAALKLLRVYTGNPKGLAQNTQVTEAAFEGKTRHITIHDICKRIGYTG